MLVGLMILSRWIVILRVSLTRCSVMPSLISSFVTLLKAGQKKYPLICSRMNGVLRSILDHKTSSSVEDFFRVILLHIY